MVKQLIEHFVMKLVDKPEQVKIVEIESPTKTIMEIRVSAQDIAKVIGREGRTFKALRSLLQAVDPKVTRDIVVDIIA